MSETSGISLCLSCRKQRMLFVRSFFSGNKTDEQLQIGLNLNVDLNSFSTDRESFHGGGGGGAQWTKWGMDMVLEWIIAESSCRLKALNSNESYRVLPQSHTWWLPSEFCFFLGFLHFIFSDFFFVQFFFYCKSFLRLAFQLSVHSV